VSSVSGVLTGLFSLDEATHNTSEAAVTAATSAAAAAATAAAAAAAAKALAAGQRATAVATLTLNGDCQKGLVLAATDNGDGEYFTSFRECFVLFCFSSMFSVAFFSQLSGRTCVHFFSFHSYA
jgi:hypothetical protein